jgi:hypothetical protein
MSMIIIRTIKVISLNILVLLKLKAFKIKGTIIKD